MSDATATEERPMGFDQYHEPDILQEGEEGEEAAEDAGD